MSAITNDDRRRTRPASAIAMILAVALVATCGSSSPQSDQAVAAPAAPVTFEPLPERPGPRTVTSYTVPHVQEFVDPVPEVDSELRRLIFSLPDIDRRPSITSISGTDALWLGDGAPAPAATLREREFAHIHPDGSLHLVLPVGRAIEAIEAKWAEFHPWVGRDDFWDGMVMLYTPQSADEANVTLQLVVDSYNFVTGRSIAIDDLI